MFYCQWIMRYAHLSIINYCLHILLKSIHDIDGPLRWHFCYWLNYDQYLSLCKFISFLLNNNVNLPIHIRLSLELCTHTHTLSLSLSPSPSAESWGPVVLSSLSPPAAECHKEDHTVDTPWRTGSTPQEIQTRKLKGVRLTERHGV